MLEEIEDKIKKSLTEEGFELIDLSLKRRGGRLILKILADRENIERGGITLAECAGLNRKIVEALRREDIFGEDYLLEVSSPGLDRPLVTDADLRRARGRWVRITITDNTVKTGKLKDVGGEEVIIETKAGVEEKILRERISRAKLDIRL